MGVGLKPSVNHRTAANQSRSALCATVTYTVVEDTEICPLANSLAHQNTKAKKYPLFYMSSMCVRTGDAYHNAIHSDACQSLPHPPALPNIGLHVNVPMETKNIIIGWKRTRLEGNRNLFCSATMP